LSPETMRSASPARAVAMMTLSSGSDATMSTTGSGRVNELAILGEGLQEFANLGFSEVAGAAHSRALKHVTEFREDRLGKAKGELFAAPTPRQSVPERGPD
jgi:hypothetical protein